MGGGGGDEAAAHVWGRGRETYEGTWRWLRREGTGANGRGEQVEGTAQVWGGKVEGKCVACGDSEQRGNGG